MMHASSRAFWAPGIYPLRSPKPDCQNPHRSARLLRISEICQAGTTSSQNPKIQYYLHPHTAQALMRPLWDLSMCYTLTWTLWGRSYSGQICGRRVVPWKDILEYDPKGPSASQKNRSDYSIWDLKPAYSGTWTCNERTCS